MTAKGWKYFCFAILGWVLSDALRRFAIWMLAGQPIAWLFWGLAILAGLGFLIALVHWFLEMLGLEIDWSSDNQAEEGEHDGFPG